MQPQLDLADVRRIYSLLEECCESWDDAAKWQRHLVTGLDSLVGGHGATLLLSNRRPGASAVLDFHSHARAHVVEAFAASGGEMLVPGAQGAFAQLETQECVCKRLAELSDAATYERSELYQRFMRPEGHHDTLSAIASSKGTTHVNLSIARDKGDTSFSERDRAVLAALASEIAVRIGHKLSMRHQRGRHGLAPREIATLERLLVGDSEKQVAAHLKLSVVTVHEYVGAIYRYFAVHSRGELLAYFLRRVPSEVPGSAPSTSTQRF